MWQLRWFSVRRGYPLGLQIQSMLMIIMGNIFNDITLTLNEDLDPDINMFDTITRSPSKYFSEDEFNDMVDSSTLQSNLKIAHLNIRSYGKNQSYLWTYSIWSI